MLRDWQTDFQNFEVNWESQSEIISSGAMKSKYMVKEGRSSVNSGRDRREHFS